MSKCNQCNVEVLDDTKVCPLCHGVIEDSNEMENSYPDIRFRTKVKVLFARIYLFVAIAIELIFIGITFYRDLKPRYVIITGIVLSYIYAVIKYTILGKSSYKLRALIVAFVTIGSMTALDYFSGFYKWSVNYVLPSVIIALDLGVIILMIVNHRNWQSYMMTQIVMIVLSLFQFVLYGFGIITNPIVAYIASYVSLLLFLGTFIIGGRRARVELRRRFHI